MAGDDHTEDAAANHLEVPAVPFEFFLGHVEALVSLFRDALRCLRLRFFCMLVLGFFAVAGGFFAVFFGFALRVGCRFHRFCMRFRGRFRFFSLLRDGSRLFFAGFRGFDFGPTRPAAASYSPCEQENPYDYCEPPSDRSNGCRLAWHQD